MEGWKKWARTGYWGKRRDSLIASYNREFGKDGWQLLWVVPDGKDRAEATYDFLAACHLLYEESYFRYLKDRPDDVELICSYGECYDNAVSNIQSGLDYSVQEAFSTHIQDIAVRCSLKRLGRWFEGPADRLLQIRSKDSEGFRFGPGNVPAYDQSMITQPSLAPRWANEGSVEDLWQSDKWIYVREGK